MPPAPPKRPRRSRVILIGVIAAVVVLTGLAALIGQAKTPVTQVGATPNVGTTDTAESNAVNTADANASAELTAEAMTPTSPPAPTQPPNPHGDVGVTQHSGYWTVTVNSIKTSQGDLVAPKAGDTYVFINVTATNTDTSTHLISVIDFSLRGPDGTTYPYGATDTQEPSGNVLSGQPIRGNVVFEVPASVHDFTMQFDGDFNPDDTVQWSLSI